MNRPVDRHLELAYEHDNRGLSRRQFIRNASALGLSTAAAIALLDTRPASGRAAMQATPTGGEITTTEERLSAALVTSERTGDLGGRGARAHNGYRSQRRE